jgi:RNA polymerase sigma-70 factor (ECF subfamily)
MFDGNAVQHMVTLGEPSCRRLQTPRRPCKAAAAPLLTIKRQGDQVASLMVQQHQLCMLSRPASGLRRRRDIDRDPRAREAVAHAVARVKGGDRDALRFIYSAYADNVFGYVCSIVKDEHDAEDITQQVFLKLITVIDKYERRTMPFSAWILRVAHNAAIDHLRASRTVPCEEVRAPDDAWDDSGLEPGRSFRHAMGALPEDQRKVVYLRHVMGFSPGEIASSLGRSENAVHGLHHRGRRALQQELAALGEGPMTAARARAC